MQNNQKEIIVNNITCKPREMAEHAFMSWCEQYNDACDFQKAWDAYEDEHGVAAINSPELQRLILSAITLGTESALNQLSGALEEVESFDDVECFDGRYEK